jgi:hypothetical protein
MNKGEEVHIAATDSKEKKRVNARMKKEKDPTKLQTTMILRSKRRTILLRNQEIRRFITFAKSQDTLRGTAPTTMRGWQRKVCVLV